MLEGNIVNYFNTKKPQLFKSTYVTNLVIGISRFSCNFLIDLVLSLQRLVAILF